MKKEIRQQVFNKYNGKCAYCGCDLTKSFHVDHLECVHRVTKFDHEKQKLVPNGMMYPENDNVENYMPACPSCNMYKSTCKLEVFRWKISHSIIGLNNNSAQYKFGKRFGLITETEKPVTFYFETLEQGG